MAKRWFRILKSARRHAVAWFGAQTERVQLLIAFIPSFEDAFNADNLPLSFILKRDSRAPRERHSLTVSNSYFRELDAQPESWKPIVSAAKRGRVTLLYSSRDTERNNAVALRQYLLAKLRRQN